MGSLPPALNTPLNQRVLNYLADKSARDEIASILIQGVKPLGGASLYCPDPASYRYVIAWTQDIVFGFAVGMDTLGVRLDERMRARALQTGAVPCPDCGPEWVAVMHHLPDSDWPRVDVEFWLRKAYVWARES